MIVFEDQAAYLFTRVSQRAFQSLGHQSTCTRFALSANFAQQLLLAVCPDSDLLRVHDSAQLEGFEWKRGKWQIA